jgi:hypothetical protein
MTTETYTGRRLDAQVHQALWPRHNVEGNEYCDGAHEKSAGRHWRDIPAYSTDPAAARLVEDEIERRGLQEPYVRALVGGAEEATHRLWYCGVDDLWRVATATPEQRCRAALAVVGEG